MATVYGDDDGIMSTNDAANLCKRTCVHLNYWEDPFVECFAKGPLTERKPPEINRGHYARVSAVTQLINQFLSIIDKSGSQAQIINLGSGFDTFFWRLKTCYRDKTVKNFVEIDLPGVTGRKVFCIRRKPQLLQVLGEDIKFSGSELHATDYHLITFDLRSLHHCPHVAQTLKDKLLTECGIDPKLPTIFISECVLVYMETPCSHSLLKWITETFSKCVVIHYEQVNLDDRFGEVMRDTLHDMHADLLGIESCSSLESQKERFKECGFDDAQAWDMNSIYNKFLPRAEVDRIERIEFLDEKNLLEQLLNHYCIALASKGFSSLIKMKDAIGF